MSDTPIRKVEYWITYFEPDEYDGSLQESCYKKFNTYEEAEKAVLVDGNPDIRFSHLFIRKVFVL